MFQLTNANLSFDQNAGEDRVHLLDLARTTSKLGMMKMVRENIRILSVVEVLRCQVGLLVEIQSQISEIIGLKKMSNNRIRSLQTQPRFKFNLKCTMLINKYIKISLMITLMLN